MTFIVATNVVASRPPERRPTGTPHARANTSLAAPGALAHHQQSRINYKVKIAYGRSKTGQMEDSIKRNYLENSTFSFTRRFIQGVRTE